MNLLLDRWPKLPDLAKTGKQFLLTFLSTRKGFKYLTDVYQWTEREMDHWMEIGNKQYVERIENHLIRALDFT